MLAGSKTTVDTILVSSVGGGSSIKFATSGVHGFSVGQVVALNDMDEAGYNQRSTVSVINTNSQFTVPVAFISTTGTGKVDTTTTANAFTLGTSTLGGARFVNRFFPLEEGGEFRSIQFEVTQSGLNEDIGLHNIFAEVELGADSMEN